MSVKGSFKTSLFDANPYLSEEFDIERNGLTPKEVSVAEEKVKRFWKCRVCEYKWDATVRHRAKLGTGCPRCAGHVLEPSKNSLAVINPTLASEWHPTKNGTTTPYDFRPGSNEIVWWYCSNCTHSWKASINTRNSQSTGCPECMKRRTKTSFPEKTIYFYLKQVFPNTKSCFRINGVEADIYVPEVNLIIEYDGILYHQHKEDKDSKKNEFFKDYNMIRIRETGLDHLTSFGCLNFSLDPKNKKQFREIITSIIGEIESLGVKIPYTPDIDIRRDAIAIKSLTAVVEVDNSFASRRPDLVYLWDTSGINGRLTPENTYGNAIIDIHWECPRRRKFTASPDRMSRIKEGNTGCPYCSNKIIIKGYNDLATTHPMIAREFSKNLSTDKKPTEISFGSNDLILWRCSDCNELFECPVCVRTGKWAQDCPKCTRNSREIKMLSQLHLNDEIIGFRFLYGKRIVDMGLKEYKNLNFSKTLDTVPREELLPYEDSYKTKEEIKQGLIIPDYSNDIKFIKRLKLYFN